MRAQRQAEKERLTAAKLSDKAKVCARSGMITHSSFLSPAEQELAYPAAQAERVLLVLDGGYDDAERKIAFFLSCEVEALREDETYPIRALRVTPRGKTWVKKAPSHRDYLGAALGLGLTRDVVGDVVAGEEGAFLLALAKAAEFLAENLTQVGAEAVSASLVPLSDVVLPQKEAKEVTRTVASLRLDCLLAAAYNLSRENAKTLVLSGTVLVNHRLATRPEVLLSPGDVLSVRGKGRVVLLGVGNPTKKDRLPVTMALFS